MNLAVRKLVLLRTGQTASSRAGDDADTLAGRPVLRTSDLRDLGDGTIFDPATGLYWVKQPELIIPGAAGVHATNQVQTARGNWANSTDYKAADLAKDTTDSTYWVCAVAHTSAAAATTFAQDRAANPTYWRQTVWTASAANLTTPAGSDWADAMDKCSTGAAGLTYAGFGPWSATNPHGWRMPNWLELASLENPAASVSPRIYTAAFPNTQTVSYWSGTTGAYDTTLAYAVSFAVSAGLVTPLSKTTYSAFHTRPVRGGIVLGQ